MRQEQSRIYFGPFLFSWLTNFVSKRSLHCDLWQARQTISLSLHAHALSCSHARTQQHTRAVTLSFFRLGNKAENIVDNLNQEKGKKQEPPMTS